MSSRAGPWAPLNTHRAPPGRHWKNVEKKGGAAAIQATPQEEHCMGVRLVEDSEESPFYCGKIVRALYLYGPHCTSSSAVIIQGKHPQDSQKVAVTVCVTLKFLPTATPPKHLFIKKIKQPKQNNAQIPSTHGVPHPHPRTQSPTPVCCLESYSMC